MCISREDLAGYHHSEVRFDSIMKLFDDDPCERFKTLRDVTPSTRPSMLLRTQKGVCCTPNSDCNWLVC